MKFSHHHTRLFGRLVEFNSEGKYQNWFASNVFLVHFKFLSLSILSSNVHNVKYCCTKVFLTSLMFQDSFVSHVTFQMSVQFCEIKKTETFCTYDYNDQKHSAMIWYSKNLTHTWWGLSIKAFSRVDATFLW